MAVVARPLQSIAWPQPLKPIVVPRILADRPMQPRKVTLTTVVARPLQPIARPLQPRTLLSQPVMHNMSMFRPIEVESLTYNERKKALLLLVSLKEKRDSLVKARMCVDGRKQKDGALSKQETTLHHRRWQ